MKLYLIRHAESEANAASDLDNPTYYYDARITQRGVEQAKKLNNRVKNLKFDNYFCSPLTRTLETFSIVFPSNKPVIEPLIREHLYHSCDVGRQPKKLKKEFNDFDFNNLNDFWWNNNKPINEKKIIQESHNDIKIRLRSFLLSIKNLNLQKIVLEAGKKFGDVSTDKIIGVGEEVISEFEARGGKMTTLTGAEKVKFDNLMTEKVLPAMMDKFDADALKAAETFTSN